MTVWEGRALFSRVSTKLAAYGMAQPEQDKSRRWFRREAARGLRANSFRVAYQPIVHVEERLVTGFEALVRWRHPGEGNIAPDRFIHALEGTPVLSSLTEFVFGSVLNHVANVNCARAFHVAINVNPAGLESPAAVDMFIDAAAAMPRDVTLVLELTERGEFTDGAFVRDSLKRIRRAGIKLALDDFGTCRSNIDLLERIQFDFLKIDRRYVARLDEDGDQLLSAFRGIARHFGVTTVAEGVETEAQHSMLRAAGVEMAQGFLYGRPVSPTRAFRKLMYTVPSNDEENVVVVAEGATI